MTVEAIISSFLAILLLLVGLLFYHYYHFRFVSFVRNEHTADMDFASIEGYTDRYYYLPDDKMRFYLYSEYEDNFLQLRRMSGPYEFEDVLTIKFPKVLQKRKDDSSEHGCQWEKTLEMIVGKDMKPGYYQATLRPDGNGKVEYSIVFIIGSRKQADIIIVAPVSTWNAYNPYGGKSLYQNQFEAKTVYYVSSQRPNNAFILNHDINVEANAFNWFAAEYESVNIIPDYFLENGTADWMNSAILVATYHCEYISRKMYDNTLLYLGKGSSMISLGANQYYWLIRWHDDYRRMECRKDLTFFERSQEYGGMWKHHFRSQSNLLGETYSGSGMHTFAPYQVTNAGHWLFEGTNVMKGNLFGMQGINEFGISGAETDKAQPSTQLEIIAHGMNCDSEEAGKNYDKTDTRWNGEGGGDIALKKLSDHHAVLAFGSIQSASGLGKDEVLTSIVKNFLKKYVFKAETQK